MDSSNRTIVENCVNTLTQHPSIKQALRDATEPEQKAIASAWAVGFQTGDARGRSDAEDERATGSENTQRKTPRSVNVNEIVEAVLPELRKKAA